MFPTPVVQNDSFFGGSIGLGENHHDTFGLFTLVNGLSASKMRMFRGWFGATGTKVFVLVSNLLEGRVRLGFARHGIDNVVQPVDVPGKSVARLKMVSEGRVFSQIALEIGPTDSTGQDELQRFDEPAIMLFVGGRGGKRKVEGHGVEHMPQGWSPHGGEESIVAFVRRGCKGRMEGSFATHRGSLFM